MKIRIPLTAVLAAIALLLAACGDPEVVVVVATPTPAPVPAATSTAQRPPTSTPEPQPTATPQPAPTPTLKPDRSYTSLSSYSRTPEGSCSQDFASAKQIDARQYLELLGDGLEDVWNRDTYFYESSSGGIARNGPTATWIFEMGIEVAIKWAPESFLSVRNPYGDHDVAWQDYVDYYASLCDAYEGRGTLRPVVIHLDKLLWGETGNGWPGHALRWKPFEYIDTGPNVVEAPSPEGLEHYTKYISGAGVIIVGGADVPDEAFLAAREAIIYMTSARPEFREILKAQQTRISLFASGDTSVLPEYSTENEPGGFAMGMTDTSMTASAEWLCYPGNWNTGGNPVIHELAHTINHVVFEELNEIYFYERIYVLAQNAIDTGLLAPFEQHLEPGEEQDNSHLVGEYWAMAVEGYIMDRSGFKDSHDTRDWIQENDPLLYDLITRYFPTEPWTYCPGVEDHLDQ